MRFIISSLFSLSLIQSSYGFTAVNFSCPEKYEVKVKEIRPFFDGNEFQKIEVKLQVLQVIKGDQIDEKTISVVKGGPSKFTVGDVFTAEFNDQWLCRVEERI